MRQREWWNEAEIWCVQNLTAATAGDLNNKENSWRGIRMDSMEGFLSLSRTCTARKNTRRASKTVSKIFFIEKVWNNLKKYSGGGPATYLRKAGHIVAGTHHRWDALQPISTQGWSYSSRHPSQVRCPKGTHAVRWSDIARFAIFEKKAAILPIRYICISPIPKKSAN